MFCKYCGTPTETDVCPNCAVARGIQQPQYQAPQPQYQAPQPQYQAPQPQYQAPQPQYQAPQPQYQAPQPQYQAPQPQYQAPQPQYQAPQQPQRRPAAPTANKGWWHFVIAGVATLALVFGLLTMFGVMDVLYNPENGDAMFVDIGFISDFGAGYVGNILYGLISLAVAGVGALYFMKKMFGIPLYDNIIGKMLKLRPGVIMGALGVSAVLFQVILYLFLGEEYTSIWGYSYSYGVGVNWTSWMMLAFYMGMVPVDMFLISKLESK